jgi:hypothetical protein
MTSLKETAQAYQPKTTLNITDLDRVDLSFPIEEREGTDKEGKSFTYKVMVVNGIDYRVPNSVLEEIKKMLDLKPDLSHVKVTSTGTGLNTRYSVSVAN